MLEGLFNIDTALQQHRIVHNKISEKKMLVVRSPFKLLIGDLTAADLVGAGSSVMHASTVGGGRGESCVVTSDPSF